MGIKIDGGKGFGSLLETGRARKAAPAKETNGVRSGDKVEFSAVLQDVARSRETLQASSPERAEKLRALREQIDSGNYSPDLQKVAASLLKFLASNRD